MEPLLHADGVFHWHYRQIAVAALGALDLLAGLIFGPVLGRI